MFEKHIKVYPRRSPGPFNRLRWLMIIATQLLFYGLPWLTINQRPAVLFDIVARRFYVGPWVFYPQDFIYLTGLLIVCALSLFLFTAVFGRVWCGYACPQTVYSQMFLTIERWIEGERSQRLRLDRNQVSSWLWWQKKVVKHTLWGLLALWTGFTFVGYFIPIRDLFMVVFLGWVTWLQSEQISTMLPHTTLTLQEMGGWPIFWIGFYGFATYGNAGFLREQVCKYMCPYARFQSAMFDKNTLVIAYDQVRGEPRQPLQRDGTKAPSAGDCIDCGLCVQVCPTGIDIRKGLQYECIGCGACVDACDSVMKKIERPLGLVKYTTEQHEQQTLLSVLFRPRVLLYTGLVWAVIIGVLAGIVWRSPFKVDVVRDRGVMSRWVDDDSSKAGATENVYRLQLMNIREHELRLSLSVESDDPALQGLVLAKQAKIELAPVESRWVVVPVRLPLPASGEPPTGTHKIRFVIDDGQHRVIEPSTFLVKP